MRRKRRYLAISVRPPDSVDGQKAFEAIRNAVRTLFGEFGLLASDLRLVRGEGHRIVVRCSSDQTWNVVLAATLVSEVDGKKVALDVVRVSGTLRKVKGFLAGDHS